MGFCKFARMVHGVGFGMICLSVIIVFDLDQPSAVVLAHDNRLRLSGI
jgi:hypothetical protein